MSGDPDYSESFYTRHAQRYAGVSHNFIQSVYIEAFQLYAVDEVLNALEGQGLRVIPEESGKLGGVMYFKDPKPMDHCVLFALRDALDDRL